MNSNPMLCLALSIILSLAVAISPVGFVAAYLLQSLVVLSLSLIIFSFAWSFTEFVSKCYPIWANSLFRKSPLLILIELSFHFSLLLLPTAIFFRKGLIVYSLATAVIFSLGFFRIRKIGRQHLQPMGS